jgi:hypothetical protein
MEIFISWSGERSHAVASALWNWLPKIVNALKPWLSSANLAKGTRWSADVASRLNSAKAGIICLTPENLHADWILFEAGALSRAVDASKVCTLLIGLETSDLEPPLSQFQATKANEADILALVKTLNKELGEHALPDEHVSEAFRMCWPTLQAELDKQPPSEVEARPVRPERQLIEEILALVRNQTRAASVPPPSDDDRDFVIQGRAQKVIFRSGGVSALTSSVEGKVMRLEVSENGGSNYPILIPRDLPLEDIEKHVLSQIRTKPELPPAESKTAGP